MEINEEIGESRCDSGEKMLVSKKDVLGQCAHWAVVLSPFIPDDFEIMLSKIRQRLEDHPDFILAEKENLGFVEFDYRELEKWIHALIDDIPEFRNMNLSKAEKEKGILVDDENRPPFVAHSSHWTVAEDHEIVDLDAFVMNVCRSIAVERES